MKFENINISSSKKRILIAPLDWGLGHATRCIPIIYELIGLDFEVIIAASGPTKDLLKTEFKNVVFTAIKGYNIRYSKRKFWLPLTLLMQLPKLIYRVYAERKWLQQIVKAYKIDAIISDNRLGLSHKTIPCIYITHQLKIKAGNRFTSWLAQKIHYHFINKYNYCWVPDNNFENDLAGELSRPQKLPSVPIKFIGPLSRFEKIGIEKNIDLLILLSGPEPQRTVFEKIITAQLQQFSGKVVLVRGLPGTMQKKEIIFDNENKIIVVDHLTAPALNMVIQQSKLVISRSGYTTIMDLVKLQQKAILVATPGQTEQEYLGSYLMSRQMFLSVPQHNFLLKDALQKAADFSFIIPFIQQDEYKKTIQETLKNIGLT